MHTLQSKQSISTRNLIYAASSYKTFSGKKEKKHQKIRDKVKIWFFLSIYLSIYHYQQVNGLMTIVHVECCFKLIATECKPNITRCCSSTLKA